MRVQAITFQNQNFKSNKINKTQKQQNNTQNASLANFEATMPLKNQILFTGFAKKGEKPLYISPVRHYKLQEFQDKNQCYFSNIELLNQACTHHSVIDALDISPTAKFDNKRMAYVGKNMLELSIGNMIYREKDDIEPARMIEISKKVLSDENLRDKADTLGLSELLLIDEAYLRGRVPKKPYVEMFRALIGAMIADNDSIDFEYTNAFIERLFIDEIKKECSDLPQNPIIELMEYVTEKGYNPSKIRFQTIMKDNGYASRVYYDRKYIDTAFKDYKEAAEQEAARNALRSLKNGFVKL